MRFGSVLFGSVRLEYRSFGIRYIRYLPASVVHWFRPLRKEQYNIIPTTSQGALNKADTDGLLILKASTASHSISAWSLDRGNRGGKRGNYSCMPMWKCSLISSEISEDDSNGALKKIPRHSSSSTMGPFWTEKNMLKNMPDFWPFFIGVWTTFYFVNHQTLAKISAFWLHGIANIFFNNYWFKNGLVM